MKFKDKVVLITWASRWIGMATALHFGKERASVVVNYLNSEEKANKVVENIQKMWWKAIAIKCDISEEGQVIKMISIAIETYWRIDILVNNAAISTDIPIFERTVEQWKRTMDVNLLWTFLCSKYALLEMLKKWSWRIINLSSINGTKHFYSEQVDYDTSKAGIISLTQNLAKFAGPKIFVNAIAPGNIDNYNEGIPTGDPTEQELNKVYLKRHWKIIEIVKAILFLASDASSFINGTTIFVDWWCNSN